MFNHYLLVDDFQYRRFNEVRISTVTSHPYYCRLGIASVTPERPLTSRAAEDKYCVCASMLDVSVRYGLGRGIDLAFLMGHRASGQPNGTVSAGIRTAFAIPRSLSNISSYNYSNAVPRFRIDTAAR
jgi:hypothetical protein